MLNRLLLIVVVVPLAIVLVALAVANRHAASFTIDPFNPGNPALSMQAPLFVLLFLALAIGMVVGGCATWLRQGCPSIDDGCYHHGVWLELRVVDRCGRLGGTGNFPAIPARGEVGVGDGAGAI
jgi:hypothetical protein